jgi:hypothetical protein
LARSFKEGRAWPGERRDAKTGALDWAGMK